MFSLVAAVCGLINVFLLFFVAPIYAYKKRLNFWKEPFSHLGGRQDTKNTFRVGLSIIYILQLIFCLGILQTFNPGILSSIILFTSVFFGILAAFSVPEQKIHQIGGLVSIVCALIFSILVGANLFLHPIFQPLGNISLVVSSSMSLALLYYLHRKHFRKHRINGVAELFVTCSIILWNLCISLILLSFSTLRVF